MRRQHLAAAAILLVAAPACKPASDPSPPQPQAQRQASEAAVAAPPAHAAKPASVRPSSAAAAAPASHCRPAETIIYSCAFDRATVSVCRGDGQVSYRYGRAGRPELEIASDGQDGRAFFGRLRGQGNGEQVSVRFANGDYHYSIYAAVHGDATIRPGESVSGLVVEKGRRELAHHRCPAAGELQDGESLHGLGGFLPIDADPPWY